MNTIAFLYRWRGLVIAIHDTVMIALAWAAAFLFYDNLQLHDIGYWPVAKASLLLVICVQVLLMLQLGLYRSSWRYASIPDLIRILKAVALGTITITIMIYSLSQFAYFPRTVLPLYALFLCALLCGPRLFYRWLREGRYVRAHSERVLILGAGLAAESLIRDLLRSPKSKFWPIAMLDDDPITHGQEIHGVRVIDGIAALADVVVAEAIARIIIAIPTATSQQMRTIVALCEKTGVPFVTLPALSDVTSGNITIDALRAVELEDLLGRDQVAIDDVAVTQCVQNKVVLVTGAGGSIGAELCRHIARMQPAVLVLVDHSEFNLYQIDNELSNDFPDLNKPIYLASVTNVQYIMKIFALHKPQVVFHAAAYKHVPLLQQQVLMAVTNNVLGTKIVADAATAHHAERFIYISTDKAVNPTNIMGATKRVAELLIASYKHQCPTQFITVRFGNVLGSTGSVIPRFKQQIQAGGPVTVTHPDITRFFMTIPEASLLILQAASLGSSGDIYVLDMGRPVKIRYMAEQLIQLAGYVPDVDVDIVYTGLRAGEKMHEELFYPHESPAPTTHKKIKVVSPVAGPLDVARLIHDLELALQDADEAAVYQLLLRIVPQLTITIPRCNTDKFAEIAVLTE